MNLHYCLPESGLMRNWASGDAVGLEALGRICLNLSAYRATQNTDNEMQPFPHTSSESLLNHQETEGSGI